MGEVIPTMRIRSQEGEETRRSALMITKKIIKGIMTRRRKSGQGGDDCEKDSKSDINEAKRQGEEYCRNLLEVDYQFNRIEPSSNIILPPNAEQG